MILNNIIEIPSISKTHDIFDIEIPLISNISNNILYIDIVDYDLQLEPYDMIDEIKKRYLSLYDFATVKISSYENGESSGVYIPVVYELMVKIDNKYYTLDKKDAINEVSFSNLVVGKTYYIKASTLNGLYKSQIAEVKPDKKDGSLNIELKANLNIANSKIGLSLSLHVRNYLDNNYLITIKDQPRLSLTKKENNSYVVTGVPEKRTIEFEIEQFVDLTQRIDYISIDINGSINPVKAINNIVYEAPYRILKQLNPDIDDLLVANPNYSKIIIQSEYIYDMNIGSNLYVSTGGGSYVKDIIYEHTNTFKINSVVDRITDKLIIKSLIGDLNSNDVIIIGSERMLIVSYNSTTDEVTVKRGIDGTIPIAHNIDDLVYIEKLNISNMDFSNEFLVVNNSSFTFSDENVISNIDDISINTLGIANKPYMPSNVKINGEYFPEFIDGDVVITWNNRSRLSTNIIGYYGDTNEVEGDSKTSLMIVKYNVNDVIVDTINVVVSGNSYTLVNDINIKRYHIELKTVRGLVDSINAYIHNVNTMNIFPPQNVTFEII